MIALQQTIQLFRKNVDTDSWSSTAQNLSSEAEDVSITRVLGKKSDTFSFRIKNINNKYFLNSNGFQIDDRVRVYFHPDSPTSSATNLFMDGNIREIQEDLTTGTITVSGESFLDTLFHTIIFLDVKAKTAPQLVQEVLNRVALFNRVRQIFGKNTSEWSTIGNPTTKQDGSAFPTHDETTKHFTAIELIEKYSSDDYTKDGTYLYYVNYNTTANRWEFIWRKKTNAVPAANTITHGVEPAKFNIVKRVDNVINHLILNTGNDPYGYPQEVPVFNSTSMKAVGARSKYVSSTNQILPKLITQEAQAQIKIGIQKWNNFTASDETLQPSSKFPSFLKPNPAPPPVSISDTVTISTWTERNADGSKKSPAVNIVVDTSQSWAKQVRLESYWKAKEEGQRIIELYSSPRINTTLTVDRTTKSYNIGELYNITAQNFNLTSKPLRCVQIEENIGQQTLTLEEDETTATFN